MEETIVALLVQLEEIERNIFAGNNLSKQEEELLWLRYEEIAALIEKERRSVGLEYSYQDFISSDGATMFAYIAPDDVQIYEDELPPHLISITEPSVISL